MVFKRIPKMMSADAFFQVGAYTYTCVSRRDYTFWFPGTRITESCGLTETKETPAATKEQKRMLHRSHVSAALKQRKAAPPRADSSIHLRQRPETKRCCDETQKELTCGTNTTYTSESGTT